MKLKPILTQLGLNDIEADIYLAALEYGPAPASELARQIGMNRITAYEALKRLSKKGLVKIRAKRGNGVKYFTAEDVSILKEKARDKKAEIKRVIENLEELEPQLRALGAFGAEKPEVYFYEGREGIKNVLLDTINQNSKESLGFASADFLEIGFDKKFLEDYWKKRTALKIPARGIIPETEAAKKLFTQERNQLQLRQVKFISAENYPFEDEIEIYGDNVGIICMKPGNEHGVIIRSKSAAKSFKAIFELVWNQFPPFEKGD